METITPKKLILLKPINRLLSMIYHTEKNNNKIDFVSTKRIIVLDPTAIGDIIMLIPFLTVLKKNFINAKITLVCAKHGKTILEPLNLIDEFIIFNGNKSFINLRNFIKNRKHLKQTLSIINNYHYDIAIEPRGDIRYLYFMHYFHSKRKISYSYSGGACFLTNAYQLPNNYKSTHIIEDKLYLLKLIGCKINKNDYYPYLIKDLKFKKQFLNKYNLNKYQIIGIHPGASRLIRQYPYYDKIIQKINNSNIFFLIFKGYNEDLAIHKIEEKLKNIKAKYLIIEESLDVYVKILSICNLILCNDSGAGHIAGAFGINTYVIFGPEKPSGIRPYNNKNVNYINHDIDCKPCYKLNCPKIEQYCFTKINIDKLCDDINNGLGGNKNGH